jgi:UDP-N-acetylglucosamine--N-acetylmuramyl-(pentapeptide) pyrophosphoryl-undecaprenol N-acetylglucosamine transferase
MTGEPTAGARSLKICLAASGGGHVRQLLDLEDVWSEHDHFFVTEDTALGRTLQRRHRTYFIPHFAWGQAKLGAPFRMAAGAVRSFFRSAAIVARERPDIVISTGAGAVFFTVVFGRVFGARVIVVESFARFDGPSLFGRLAAPWANEVVVQSPKLAAAYPKASVFDPLRMLDGAPPPKQELLFATVGATLPFDRLVHSVAQLKASGEITERVVVQTGENGARPDGVEVVESLSFDEVGRILREASIVVCHGGTGSIITALREGCHVIAMPREARRGEHYDDHQSEITEAFAARGLIRVARDAEDLRKILQDVRGRPRIMATTDPVSLKAFLRGRLAEVRRPG